MSSIWRAAVDDIKDGFSYHWFYMDISTRVGVFLFIVYMFVFLGPIVAGSLLLVFLGCVSVSLLGRIPRYVRDALASVEDAWAEIKHDEVDYDAKIPHERVKKQARSKLACKVAVRVISKVGVLKKTEANALVYQRLCLDVMEGMKVRHYDRVLCLPLAVLACFEVPEFTREGMNAVKYSVEGFFAHNL